MMSDAADPTSAPPDASGPRRWRRAWRAVAGPLRAISLLAVVGLVAANWSEIETRWDRWTRPRASAGAVNPLAEYYCPLHPTVVRRGDEAGRAALECPICGIPLSMRAKAPSRDEAAARPKTAVASYRPLAIDVQAVGHVALDERGLFDVATRMGGVLEKLYVRDVFQEVKSGDAIAEIYSPELYLSVQDMRSAQKYGLAELAASAGRRLILLGLSQADIDDAMRADNVRARLVVRAPRAGQVTKINVVEGASVAAGATVATLVDLHTVWVEAEAPGRAMSLLRDGQSAEAHVPARPGETFRGVVSLVYPEPYVDAPRDRVRVALENPHLSLRPGMSATLRMETPVAELEPFRSQTGAAPAGTVLAIPARAVSEAGGRTTVQVERTAGKFEEVDVTLGPRAGEYVAVASGLAPGAIVAIGSDVGASGDRGAGGRPAESERP